MDQEQALAHYATELFAPLNDQRFKTGMDARKSGGMAWRAWLEEEYALIDNYCKYLSAVEEYKRESERVSRELEQARVRWIDEHLERRFKSSKAYKRHVDRDID